MTLRFIVAIFLFLAFIMTSCFERKFNFNERDLDLLCIYQEGDTIYFESNLGDIDTIAIMGFGTYRNKSGTIFYSPAPVNLKWVKAKYLSDHQWNMKPDYSDISDTAYQDLLMLTHFPLDSTTYYTINYKNFYSDIDTTHGEFHTDAISLNKLKIRNYYLLTNQNPIYITESSQIEYVYWTDKYGLTAYQSINGEIWTIKKISNQSH